MADNLEKMTATQICDRLRSHRKPFDETILAAIVGMLESGVMRMYIVFCVGWAGLGFTPDIRVFHG